MRKLSVHCAFVTGGSSGIGFAVAQELIRRGSKVLLIARNLEHLREAALQLEKASNVREEEGKPSPKVSVLSLDVGDGQAVSQLIPKAVKEFGEPDLVVNCAGEAYCQYFEATSDAVFEQTLSVHVRGAWYLTKALIPYLKKNKGSIVYVSSLAGLMGVFGYSAYSTAKAALIGLAEALRSELKPEGVRVAVLCPPDTDTPGFEKENRTKPPETRVISANAGVLKAEVVARELFRGLEQGHFLIVPGAEAKLTAWAMQHLPRLVYWVIDRAVRNCRKQMRPSS
ncbi:MAG: SDR family oxidoreductase [Spirochaetales bacterium]